MPLDAGWCRSKLVVSLEAEAPWSATSAAMTPNDAPKVVPYLNLITAALAAALAADQLTSTAHG